MVIPFILTTRRCQSIVSGTGSEPYRRARQKNQALRNNLDLSSRYRRHDFALPTGFAMVGCKEASIGMTQFSSLEENLK
jgi:hypothetical protein